ncbi:MAG: recombinase family protein [Inquilinus sp.]|uniref:recombinase family protein n=1 Tax=Inquilinus sp. TaxID=1932117 RepID=UPI003F3EF281
MALVGYARVSTEDQTTASQKDELRAAGCTEIFEEKASGGSRSRPELAKVLHRLGWGDVLVVARIDRLARSLSHLLEVIEALEGRGAHFRSLHDPIDTSSPQGKFALQVLGAAAELERALIRERTKAGLRAAKARGRVGGNPALRAREPKAIRRAAVIRDAKYFAELNLSAPGWLPVVRQLRPDHSWATVVRILNGRGRSGSWTVDRLVRAVKRFVREGMADQALLDRAPNRTKADHAATLISGIAQANPTLSLRAIGAQLDAMRVKPPRGGDRWSASSVRSQLKRAQRLGHTASSAAGFQPGSAMPTTGS